MACSCGETSAGRFFGFNLLNIYDSLPFFIHMVTNTLIELNENKAHGKWYFNVPSTHKPTNQAIWILGTYENDLVRENEVCAQR